MSPLLMILLGILVLGLKQGFELILENEYATWAPALARLFVRVAGFVYWPRRDQWEADLRYLQQVEDQSGLLPAGWCLLSAPGLMLRRVAAAFGDLKPVTLSGPKAVVKRAFDVVVAMLVLLAACPLMVVAAVAVRLTSPGPAIYRQARFTRGGRVFTMYKFRTMVSGDGPDPAAAPIDPAVPYLKLGQDPRLSPVGRLLRSLSIDELPQLINVIRGDMSLVGPRPLWVAQVAGNLDMLAARHDVRAGITGWWQVNGRSDVPQEEAFRLDAAYVENWSLSLDLYILARTVGAVISRRGDRRESCS